MAPRAAHRRPVEPTPMIGRGAELDLLRTAFRSGHEGNPRVAIVRGEAGIGKTRLLREFLAEIADAPHPPAVVVATGQCIDMGAIGAPFTPVRRLLRELRAGVGAEVFDAAVGDATARATIATLVPLDTEGEPEATPSPYLAEAIEGLLAELSLTHHLVLVIEDLHWADTATIALLGTLMTALQATHLTTIASYRSDDVDRFHPLRPLLGELERNRAVVDVEVRRLTPEETAEQIEGLVDSQRSRAARDTLIARSGGIPFLVEELAELDDEALPDTLRDLVLARYERLDPETRRLARVLAAGGVHVDHDDLEAVSPLADDELDEALRALIDGGIVTADGAGYTFRHALTQEAVHGELLPSERTRVHVKYAERLAAIGDPSLSTAIAEHRLAARDTPGAFQATAAALAHAQSTHAPASEAPLVELLIELWPLVPDAAALAGSSLVAHHLRLVLLMRDLGEDARGLRAVEEGLAACGPDDVFERAALLRLKFVHLYNAEQRMETGTLHEARELLEARHDRESQILLARIYGNLADALRIESQDSAADGPEIMRLQERAIELAEQTGDAEGLSAALVTLSWDLADRNDDEPAGLAPALRALEVARGGGPRAFAALSLADLLVRLARYEDAVALAAQQQSENPGRPLSGSAARLEANAVEALFLMGRRGEAEARRRPIHRAMPDESWRFYLDRLSAHAAVWDADPGARAQVDALWAEGELISEDEIWRELVDADAILAAADARDERITQRMARLAGFIDAVGVEPSQYTRRFAAITGARLLRLTSSTTSPESTALRAAIERALARWPQHALGPAVDRLVRALLLDADGAPLAQRVAAWEASAASGRLPEALCDLRRLHLAEVLIEIGSRDAAAVHLTALATDDPEDATGLVTAWAVDLAARAGIPIAGAVSPASSSRGIAALTPRELQVLALVAEGLTNPQIGGRLYISPKTASVHVSAILAKIGAANRAEAAALYAAQGS